MKKIIFLSLFVVIGLTAPSWAQSVNEDATGTGPVKGGPAVVPEPMSLSLLGLGLAGIVMTRKMRINR